MSKSFHVVETLYYCVPATIDDTEHTALGKFLTMDPVTRDSFCQECRERQYELKDDK